jgi:hypothetical protein
MSARTILLPDLDNDLTAALTHVEELFLTFAAWEEEDPELALPAPLAGDVALEAVRRLWGQVAPSQGRRAVEAGLTGRQLAPDGRYEHVPLRAVDVEQADVEILAAAARALGDPRAVDAVRDAAEQVAAAFSSPMSGPYRTGAELVARVAQLAGVLDLADTEQARLLRERLAAADPAVDMVFTRAEEAAYQATAGRINAMWALGDPIERFRY